MIEEKHNDSLYMMPYERPAWAEVMGEDSGVGGLFAEFKVDRVSFRWRWIPPGEFWTGARANEKGSAVDEEPQHFVRISKGFWMGETAVSISQWMIFRKKYRAMQHPSRSFDSSWSYPAEVVSWEEALDFIGNLKGRVPLAEFRLPTEAEWEYACRAGTVGSYYSGAGSIVREGPDPALDALAWYRENSFNEAHPAKGKRPNGWGLYDMLGNVWEWCADAPRQYKAREEVDPVGVGDEWRAIRGGSYKSAAKDCRCASRGRLKKNANEDGVGFRLVIEG